MHMKLVARLIAISAAMLLAFAASAQANYGKVLVHCGNNGNAQVDPIKQFGVDPSAHLHTSGGALAFSATTTLLAMQNATTSCEIPSDHSLLWVPALIRADGTVSDSERINYYLANEGQTIDTVPPNGLRYVAGNPSYVGPSGAGFFVCTKPDGTQVSLHTVPTYAQCGGSSFQLEVYGLGQCWNGADYGAGLGGSDVAPSITWSCGSAGGFTIPEVELAESFGPDALGGHLSSDADPVNYPGSSAHFDYVFNWRQNTDSRSALVGTSALDDIIAQCLNTSKTTPGGPVTCTNFQGEVFHSDASGSVDWSQYNNPVTN